MPYVGRDPRRGNYLKLDDIQSSFNGSDKTFNLTSGGTAYYPDSTLSVLVSVGGTVLEPTTDYGITDNQIIFTNAPESSYKFFAIVQSLAVNIGVPNDASVTGDKLSTPLWYDEYFKLDSINNRVGIGTVDPQQNLDVRGNTIFGIDQASGNPGTSVGITTIRGHHVNSDSDYAQLYLSNSKSAGGGTAPTSSIRAGRTSNNYGTNLSFWTNGTGSAGDGTERLSITETGDVEIGGNDAAQSILLYEGQNSPSNGDVCGSINWASRTDKTITASIKVATHNNGNGTDGVLTFWTANDTANADSANHLKEKLRIDQIGRLLIGTQKTYSDAGYYDDITINNSDGSGATGGTGITLISSTNSWGSILFGVSGNNDVGAIKYDHNTNRLRFVVNTIDPAFIINGLGHVGIGTETDSGSRLTLYGTAAVITQNSNTGTGSGNGFYMGNGNGTIAYLWNYENESLRFATDNKERIRITADGKIGINTTGANNGPDAPLHIYGDSDTTPIIAFTRSTTHDDWQGAGIGMHDEGGTFKGSLTFYTHGSSGTKNDSVIEQLRITSSGVLKLTGQSTSFETAGITHHTNNNLYIRGGTTGAILQSIDGQEAWIVQNDYVAASTGDEERLRIDSDGNIGIGTDNQSADYRVTIRSSTSPHSALLLDTTESDYNTNLYFAKQGTNKWIIGNKATNDAFRIVSGSTEVLSIDSEGKIFINRTVSATSGNHPALEVETLSSGSEDSTFATGIDFKVDGVFKKRLAVTDGDGEGGGDWIFYRDNGTNEALRINSTGVSTFKGDITLEAAGANRISMRHTSGGNAVIKNPTAANLSFGTNDQDNELTIENGGNIGIGTDNPNAKIDIVANSASGYIASFRQDNASNPASIWIDSPTDNNIRPTHIDMACAGNLHWSFGQAYGSHVNNTFHFSTSNLGDGETGSKLAITKAGNVGIGTVTPGEKLDVEGSLRLRAGGNWTTYATRITSRLDSTHMLSFEAYHNSSTPVEVLGTYADSGGSNMRTVIAANGMKVGIGTDNPSFHTDIVNGEGNIGANANNPGDLSVTGANKTLTGGGANVFINSNTAHAVDTGGTLGFTGRNTDSSRTSILWGTIKGAKENVTSTNTAGYLAFGVANHSAGALVERLRITSAGTFGFNISTPNIREILHVHKTTSDEAYLRFTNTGTGTGAGDGFNIGINASEEALIWNKEDTDMLFGTHGETRMVIDKDGNVGINTTQESIAGMSKYLSISARNITNGGAALELVGARTSGDTTLGVINFVNQTANVAQITARYQGSTTDGSLHFYTSGNDRVEITSDGEIQSADGGFVSYIKSDVNVSIDTDEWSANTYYRVVNDNVLGDSASTYLVNFHWSHEGSGTPWIVRGNFLWTPTGANHNGAVGREFIPVQTAHSFHGPNRYLTFQGVAGGNVRQGLQVKTDSGWDPSNNNDQGVLYIRATRIADDWT